VKATPGLLAALSHLPPDSIGMRLQNAEYVVRAALADCRACPLRRARSGRSSRQHATLPRYLLLPGRNWITADIIALGRENALVAAGGIGGACAT
jgi:hypothetical protein